MKEGWKYVKINNCCDPVKTIQWKKQEGIQFNYIDLTSVDRETSQIVSPSLINSASAPSRAKQIIKEGDIIFATTRPTLKRLALIPSLYNEDICSTGFCVIRPNNSILFSKWVFYSLKYDSFYKYIEPLQTGASYPAVTDKVVKDYVIPLPPLSEQQSIVAHLDASFAEIDALKAKAAEEVANAKAMFDAALREEMTPKEGWEEKKLNEISKYSIGLTYKPSDVSENGTIVLRSANIQNDQLDLSDIVRVTCNIKDSLYVEENDILMCSRNGSARLVGKVAMLPKMKEKMTYGTFMMIIKSTYSPFLFYFFKSDIFRNQIKHGEANMINQITRYMLDEIVVGLPSPIVQQRIVAKLDTLRSHLTELEQKYNLIAANCDALKQAILRETFE